MRDDFDQKTKDLLAKRVGYICSNPDCGVSTVGPSRENKNKIQYIGEAAHIYSASKNSGPRANPALNSQERKDISNGIHLCAKCASLIDKNNGKDYSAELLFKWKELAEEKALHRIYNFFPSDIWKNVKFSNLERDYSSALTSIGLNEKNVLSCPRNNEIICFVKEKLLFSFQCCLSGRTGCGKSLLAYQIAYDYYLRGWEIFKLSEYNTNLLICKPIPKNENIFLIIDDAHILTKNMLEDISGLRCENVHIIFIWNLTISTDDSFLKYINKYEINEREQVELLKKYCLSNKKMIEQLVKKIDKNIGEHIFQTSIEQKIMLAAREKTPWLFNYFLSDGWKNARHEKNILRIKDRLDVITITIALFQIVTLDHGVEKEAVFSKVTNFSNDILWLSNANDLIETQCIIDRNLIRLKHYQYAQELLRNIFPENDDHVINYFNSLCEEILLDNRYRKGYNNLIQFLKYDIPQTIQYLYEKDILKNIFNELLIQKYLSSDDALLFDSLLTDSNIVILEKKSKVLTKWFDNIDKDNAIGFSRIVNTLYNKKYTGKFISKIILTKIKEGISDDNIITIYNYSCLLERLHLFLYKKEEYKNFCNDLQLIDFSHITSRITKNNLYCLSMLVVALFNLNKIATEKLLDMNIKTIAQLINEQPIETYYQIQDMINENFGQIALILSPSKFKKKNYLYTQAQKFVSGINIEKIVNYINSITLRETDALINLLLFFDTHNRTIIKRIFNDLNLEHFKYLFKDQDILDYEHERLLYRFFKHNKEEKKMVDYLDFLIEKYNVYTPFLLVVYPEKCTKMLIERNEKNIVFSSMHDHHYTVFGILLYDLQKKKLDNVAIKIIKYNMEFIQSGLFSKTLNIDNNIMKILFYYFLYKNYEVNLKDIFINGNINDLISKINRLVKGKKYERQTAALYLEFVKKFNPVPNDRVKGLLAKYSNKLFLQELNYDDAFSVKIK